MAIGTSLGAFFPDAMSFHTESPFSVDDGIGNPSSDVMKDQMERNANSQMEQHEALMDNLKPIQVSDKKLIPDVEDRSGESLYDAGVRGLKEAFDPKRIQDIKNFPLAYPDERGNLANAKEYYESHPKDKPPTQKETDAAAAEAIRLNKIENMNDTSTDPIGDLIEKTNLSQKKLRIK